MITKVIISTMLTVAAVFLSDPCLGEDAAEPAVVGTNRAGTNIAEWTVMVFMNAKNNLEPCAFHNFRQMSSIGGTDSVHIVVEFGRPNRHYYHYSPPDSTGTGDWSKTLRFFVKKDTQPLERDATQDLGKIDMGSGANLAEFVQWAYKEYPAKKHMLIIWDHGQGWRLADAITLRNASGTGWAFVSFRKALFNLQVAKGRPIKEPVLPTSEVVHGIVRYVSNDEDTGNKMYNRDIQDSLKSRGVKLDVIGYDACLMSMIETAYGMREIARVLVASQELEPGNGWDYEDVLERLEKNPKMDAKDLGNALVQSYQQSYQGAEDTTLSAIDLEAVPKLADAVHQWSVYANDHLSNQLAWIQGARTNCYSYAPDYGMPYVDMGAFLDKYADSITDVRAVQLTQSARQLLRSCVLSNYAAPSRQGKYGSNGLSIYFPQSALAFTNDADHDGYLLANTYFPVEFVNNIAWAKFLYGYFQGTPR